MSIKQVKVTNREVQPRSSAVSGCRRWVHTRSFEDAGFPRKRKSVGRFTNICPGPERLPRMVTNLTFLRRPTIGLGAHAAHQHRSLIVAEAASLEERLDGLL